MFSLSSTVIFFLLTNGHLITRSKIVNKKRFSLLIKRTLENFHEIFGLNCYFTLFGPYYATHILLTIISFLLFFNVILHLNFEQNSVKWQ